MIMCNNHGYGIELDARKNATSVDYFDYCKPQPNSLWNCRLRHLAEVLVQVLDHRLVLEAHRLRHRSEPPSVRRHRVQLARLDQELDAMLRKGETVGKWSCFIPLSRTLSPGVPPRKPHAVLCVCRSWRPPCPRWGGCSGTCTWRIMRLCLVIKVHKKVGPRLRDATSVWDHAT